MKHFHLFLLHPIAFFVFFVQTLITCFIAKSAGLFIIFLLLFVYACMQRKAKTVLWTLPLAAFMLLLNPIFYHGGERVLFTLSGYNFTLEAIENGIYCALLILCTTLLFSVLGTVLSEEKFLYIFGKPFPKIALMISMIFKHFDLLRDGYAQDKNMAKMNGIYANDHTLWQKLKTNAVIFEAFTGAALEGSIDTALSLAAKGYYHQPKTRIGSFRFEAKDAVFIAISTAFFIASLLPWQAVCLPATAVLFLIPILCSKGGERQ